MIRVGTQLYGYCNGFFGSSSYCDKRIEAIGVDWIVARDDDGLPHFADFPYPEEMDALVAEWSKKEDK